MYVYLHTKDLTYVWFTVMPSRTRHVINQMLIENSASPDEVFTSGSIVNDDNDPAYEDVDNIPDLSHEGGEYQEIANTFSRSDSMRGMISMILSHFFNNQNTI